MTLLPKKIISRLAGSLARSSLSRYLIPVFTRYYLIKQDDAELPLKEYRSLSAFFVRKLKPGLRPVAEGENIIVSPVDGVVSQLGPIREGKLIQAKGKVFTVQELLGQDREKSAVFNGGLFVTIYLSPSDYHRIHSPMAGRVIGSTYVPGALFPVNPFGVRVVNGLFARNERLITYLTSPAGLLAVVKVGATIVGSIKVNYTSLVTNLFRGRLAKEVLDGPILAKGDELGYFEFGSTVILLFENQVSFVVEPGQKVRMGQAIGEINKTKI